MANHFAIYRLSDGELVSYETDAAEQRLTDVELADKGLARVQVDGPLLITEQWNAATYQKETKPAAKPSAEDTAVAALIAKPSPTVADLIEILKIRGVI